jgi:hypothetical protein
MGNARKTLGDIRRFDGTPFLPHDTLYATPIIGPHSVVEAVIDAFGTPARSSPPETAIERWIDPEGLLADGGVPFAPWLAAPELAALARLD